MGVGGCTLHDAQMLGGLEGEVQGARVPGSMGTPSPSVSVLHFIHATLFHFSLYCGLFRYNLLYQINAWVSR